MVTIKSYTDLSQSKKLADILPLESADMFYIAGKGEPVFIGNKMVACGDDDYDALGGPDILCWSLAALLDILSKNTYFANEADMTQLCYIKATNKWCVSILNCDKIENCFTDNPIDACIELILKLHEREML